jgi:alpha-tubulin suppressor-like RCC1 family protein
MPPSDGGVDDGGVDAVNDGGACACSHRGRLEMDMRHSVYGVPALLVLLVLRRRRRHRAAAVAIAATLVAGCGSTDVPTPVDGLAPPDVGTETTVDGSRNDTAADAVDAIDSANARDSGLTDAETSVEVGADTLIDTGPISVADLAARGSNTCARMTDGTAYCWGSNQEGQIGDGTISVATPPSALFPTRVLERKGGPPLRDIAQIAPGTSHTCALKTTGTVWCWGHNVYGSVGDATFDGPRLEPKEVILFLGGPPLTNVVEIGSGSKFSCARKGDGTVWCWGDGSYGQLGDGRRSARNTPTPMVVERDGALLTGIAQVAVCNVITCVRTVDGRVLCAGPNSSGLLGDGTTIDRPSPTTVLTTFGGSPLKDVVDLTAGDGHICARMADGSVVCWGDNAYGEIGDGTTVSPRMSPTAVLAAKGGAKLVDVVTMTGGGVHTCIGSSAGAIECWGRNSAGQLGDGTTLSPRLSPVPVLTAAGGPPLMNARKLVSGHDHTCAWMKDGSILCWGENRNGEIGDGTLVSSAAPVKVTISIP